MATRDANIRKLAGFALPIAFVMILTLFLWRQREVIASVIGAWGRTQTYQHGFLIVPAVLVLIWMRRRQLHLSEVRVEPLGLPLLLLSVAIGYVGSAGDLQIVRHFALVLTIISLVFTLLGRHVIAKLLFPLFFLFFAVPAGDELVPPLIDLTATISTEGLKLLGVPVFREGVYIEVPNGKFEVARVCSGIRYLIASTAFATLFAAMYLRTFGRRLLLLAIGIVLPLIANGLRALGIILLAYLSDMRIAVGVDHIIYGWLFFGIVIVFLIWIGTLLARSDTEDIEEAIDASAVSAEPLRPVRMVTVSALSAALIFANQAISLPVTAIPSDGELLPTLPSDPGAWSGPTLVTPVFTSDFKGIDGELSGVYTKGSGDPVALHVYYYLTQRQGQEIINTENALVDNETARVVASDTVRIKDPTTSHREVKEVIVRQGRLSFLIWYWYDINGFTTLSPLRAKMIQIANTARGRHTPASVIAIAVANDLEPEEARDQLREFLTAAGPSISPCLWRTDPMSGDCFVTQPRQ